MMVPAAAFPTSHPVRLTQHDIVSADYAHPVMYSITTTGCGLVAVALSVQDVMNCVPNASHARVCKQPTATMSQRARAETRWSLPSLYQSLGF
jgi:hypothetical protein